MKKKILAGLLSAMMVVSLAACGSSETGATATESKSETTANTADGTAAAATDAQGGYEGKEVKVWISSGVEFIRGSSVESGLSFIGQTLNG